MREENGKFTGIPPAAISYPSGTVGGSPWWNPGCHYSEKTFAFPRALSFLSEAMVIAYLQTGEEQYHSWLATLANHRRDWIEGGRINGEEGDLNWTRQQLRKSVHNGLRKYRLSTHDTQYDDILLDAASPYDRFRLLGTDDDWLEQLETTAQALSWNAPAYTSEVRFTDRVIKFHSAYWNQFFDEKIAKPDTELLYNMITGDWGSPGYLPLPQFRWAFDPRFLRVHVLSNTLVSLYVVHDQPISGTLHTLQQQTGRCLLSCSDDIQEAVIDNQSCDLELPNHVPCTLEILD